MEIKGKASDKVRFSSLFSDDMPLHKISAGSKDSSHISFRLVSVSLVSRGDNRRVGVVM